MFSTEAEYLLFKEFSDFSIGNFQDGWPHYNGLALYDEVDGRVYYNKVSDLFEKFLLEIETNLVFLSESKVKSAKYLSKIEKKLEDTREKLHDYHYLLHDADGYDIEGWAPIVWDRSQYYIDKLINYCRSQLINLDNILILSGRKRQADSMLINWTKGGILLEKLYSALEKHISKIPYHEFESHFIPKPSRKINLKPLNWQKEKYLLIFLFDSLSSRGFFDETYAPNCDVLLSKHFTCKDKPITPRQLASARHSFKRRINNSPDSKRNTTYTYLVKCVSNLNELSKRPQQF